MEEGDRQVKTKIKSEKVANMLNQWYRTIRQLNVDQAIAMKDEIEHVLPDMEENQDLLLYFNLLDFRHKIMLENLKESQTLFQQLEQQGEGVEKTNSMIEYYFYFFSGQYEIHNKNYIKAINFYQIAEKKLGSIPDEIEHAEFYYRVAIAYYRIKQHFFSLSYAEKALDSFRANCNYAEKTINCEMILGGNKMDLFRYEEAEIHFNNALDRARKEGFRYAECLALYNLGINYGRRNILVDSANYFKESLDIAKSENPNLAIKAKFEIALVLYKFDFKDKAKKWCKEGLSEAQEINEEEYITKFKFIRALYDDGDSKDIEKGLQYLEDKKFWFDAAEFMFDAALYYKKLNDIKKAVHYFEKSHWARNQIFKVTEELK